MQDHAMASYNAAISVFPNVKILMCYYHVKAQILKHRNLIVEERYAGLMDDMTDLHYSKDVDEYCKKKPQFKMNMLAPKCLNIFKNNGFKEFSPNGRSSTIRQVMQTQIHLLNHSMQHSIVISLKELNAAFIENYIKSLTEYYSSARNNYFNENPKFDQAVKDKATNIALKCSKKLKDKVIYTSSFDQSKQTISLVDSQCLKNCSCSCIHFLKKAVCHHVVAYSLSINADWYGIMYRQKSSFEAKSKKGAPKRLF